ncbi:hypothetical protein Tco_1404682 [Tanacetum coccineum]
MASFDYRLNPLYEIKECSSCGALYTRNCGCSKGSLEDKILVPVLDSSQRPPQNCATCGDPVDGLYCRPCAFVRKCLNEGWYTIHNKNDILNTSESSNHNTNVAPIISNPKQCNQTINELPQILPSVHLTCNSGNENSFTYDSKPNSVDDSPNNDFLNSQNKLMEKMTSICDMVGQIMQKKEAERRITEDRAAKDRYWKIPICYDDDEDYTIAITPVLSTKEVVDSLIIEDEYLDTTLTMESDEVIKSSVENLVPIPSESEGLFDDISDVPSCDNDHFDAESLLSRDILITYPKIDFLFVEFGGELAPILPDIHEADFDEVKDICNDDTSSDDDDFEDIEYVDATPPNSEIVSLEEVEDVILHDKLSNVYLLISKIEALNDNPTLSSFSYSDNSFSNHTEETRSGSTTTHDVEISLIIEPDALVINNFDELNEDECFDPGGDEIDVEDDDSFIFVIRTFLPFLTYPVDSLFLCSSGNEDTIFDLGISTFHFSPLRAGGISSEWNFHVLKMFIQTFMRDPSQF